MNAVCWIMNDFFFQQRNLVRWALKVGIPSRFVLTAEVV